MGTKMTPCYANLFMAHFEDSFLQKSAYKPLLYVRFIDDIFMIWQYGIPGLNDFVDKLNETHHSIKFTCDHSYSSIPFLDTMVSVKEGTLSTSVYTQYG